MLERFQRRLKDLIAKHRQEEVFQILWKYLLNECDIYNKLILLSDQWNDINRSENEGLLSFTDAQIARNRITRTLISLIGEFRIEDFNRTFEQIHEDFITFSNYHATTCNRFHQTEEVHSQYYLNYEQKVRHFFLYGDAKQAHRSLFERFYRYFSGTLEKWDDPSSVPASKVKVIECKPCRSGGVLHYQIEIIRKILGHLKPPLAERKLTDILSLPELKGFGADDFIFILLTVDDFNWDKELTPKVVESLLEGFCTCELPESSPSIFFFYGIEYQTNNDRVRSEVRQTLNERRNKVVPLAELQRVPAEDINEWFSRHPRLIPKGKTAHDMASFYFGSESEYDMIDIEHKFLEIIELHNQNLLSRFKN